MTAPISANIDPDLAYLRANISDEPHHHEFRQINKIKDILECKIQIFDEQYRTRADLGKKQALILQTVLVVIALALGALSYFIQFQWWGYLAMAGGALFFTVILNGIFSVFTMVAVAKAKEDVFNRTLLQLFQSRSLVPLFEGDSHIETPDLHLLSDRLNWDALIEERPRAPHGLNSLSKKYNLDEISLKLLAAARIAQENDPYGKLYHSQLVTKSALRYAKDNFKDAKEYKKCIQALKEKHAKEYEACIQTLKEKDIKKYEECIQALKEKHAKEYEECIQTLREYEERIQKIINHAFDASKAVTRLCPSSNKLEFKCDQEKIELSRKSFTFLNLKQCIGMLKRIRQQYANVYEAAPLKFNSTLFNKPDALIEKINSVNVSTPHDELVATTIEAWQLRKQFQDQLDLHHFKLLGHCAFKIRKFKPSLMDKKEAIHLELQESIKNDDIAAYDKAFKELTQLKEELNAIEHSTVKQFFNQMSSIPKQIKLLIGVAKPYKNKPDTKKDLVKTQDALQALSKKTMRVEILTGRMGMSLISLVEGIVYTILFGVGILNAQTLMTAAFLSTAATMLITLYASWTREERELKVRELKMERHMRAGPRLNGTKHDRKDPLVRELPGTSSEQLNKLLGRHKSNTIDALFLEGTVKTKAKLLVRDQDLKLQSLDLNGKTVTQKPLSWADVAQEVDPQVLAKTLPLHRKEIDQLLTKAIQNGDSQEKIGKLHLKLYEIDLILKSIERN